MNVVGGDRHSSRQPHPLRFPSWQPRRAARADRAPGEPAEAARREGREEATSFVCRPGYRTPRGEGRDIARSHARSCEPPRRGQPFHSDLPLIRRELSKLDAARLFLQLAHYLRGVFAVSLGRMGRTEPTPRQCRAHRYRDLGLDRVGLASPTWVSSSPRTDTHAAAKQRSGSQTTRSRF